MTTNQILKSNNTHKYETRSAIVSHSLYLANLLLLPGLSFLLLIWLLTSDNKSNKPLSRWNRIHLIRAIQLSVIAGIFLIIIPSIFMFASQNIDTSLMVLIVYFVTIHAGFVLIGMFNLSRAMARKNPLF
jgi:hypothetical protein